jgi:Zn-dependent protease
MSLAGPAANLTLVLFSGILIRIGTAAGVLAPPILAGMTQVAVAHGSGMWASAALLVSVFFTLNLLLFVFNLLPLPPLDGCGALPLLLGDRAAASWQRLTRQPVVGLLGLLLAWNLFGPVFGRFYRLALELLYSGGSFG